MILDFCEKFKQNEMKKSIVFSCLVKYYKDLSETGVNIPYFIRAREHYKKIIKNNKDLNHYYNEIVKTL